MNIAVIGSREGFGKEQIEHEMLVEFDLDEDRLITGGARGVDSMAEHIVESNDAWGRSPIIIRPINFENKMNYLFRNIEIITMADKILAFWDGKSRGTKFVIDYAKARNKNIKIYSPYLKEQSKNE